MNWVIGAHLADLSDARRVPLATFNMVFATGMSGDQGLVLGASTSPSSGLEDNVGGVLVAGRSSSNPHNNPLFCCSLCGAALPHCLSHGWPEVYADQSEEGKKLAQSMQKRSQKLVVSRVDRAVVLLV